MKKIILSLLVLSLSMISCVSKKKFTDLEAKQKATQDLLNTATVKLNTCLTEREALANQVDFLKKNNSDLINNMGNLTTLTTTDKSDLVSALNEVKTTSKLSKLPT